MSVKGMCHDACVSSKGICNCFSPLWVGLQAKLGTKVSAFAEIVASCLLVIPPMLSQR